MHDQHKPRVVITNCEASGNGGDGIFIGRGVDAAISGARAFNNGGTGISIGPQAPTKPMITSKKAEELANSKARVHDQWHKKPIGMIGIEVAVALISAAALWAISHYLS